MKRIITIPCKDEERTLPFVLTEIPKKIAGISNIEIRVVDKCSKNKTAEVTKKHDCVVLKQEYNLGLRKAFKIGFEAVPEREYDIFVNTDADNPSPSRYILDFVKPLVEEKARFFIYLFTAPFLVLLQSSIISAILLIMPVFFCLDSELLEIHLKQTEY